jgi:hypothetical protein
MRCGRSGGSKAIGLVCVWDASPFFSLALAIASENDIAVDDDGEGEEIVAFGATFDTNPVVLVVVVASWRSNSV